MQESAKDVTEKPSDGLKPKEGFRDIIGQSTKMLKIFDLVKKVADSDSTILVHGETGTGKGIIAKAIHNHSYRKDQPFVAINCGAIPANLLESELFGHTRGAFTGATKNKTGKFERADQGTVFLDEIGDMSQDLQVKILKVLEEGEFEQVGGNKTINVNVRIIAATHRDLEEEVQKGRFREDLFYRLYVIPISLPSLRQRKSDIPHLFSYFMKKSNIKNNRKITNITDNALELMKKYEWPGNIRELKNIIERLVVLKGEGEITIDDLPENLKTSVKMKPYREIEITEDGISLNSAVNEFEKTLILQTLEKTDWIKNQAAKLLKLNRTTLVEKIKRHHLSKSSE